MTSLPPAARRTFNQLLLEPLTEPEELRRAVAQYAGSFSVDVASNDFVDAAHVEALRAGCIGLLELWAAVSDENRRLIQAAVQFFLLEGDGDEDRGIGGLEDDIMVFNEVVSRLGRMELWISSE